jgi:hypothetical protein
MSRTTSLLIAVAAALLAQPAHALGVSAALPQTGGGGGTTVSTGGVRRCSNCASASAERRARERLLLKIDSIRWEIENRRMTDADRERASAELFATVRELQRSLDDESGQRFGVTVARSGGAGQATATSRSGEAQAVVAGQRPYAVALRNPTRGYLGVTFEGVSSSEMTATDHRVRFIDYPRITLVEPSSPAERAGVLRGDTVLAFNGTDVTSEVISFTKLLVPDARITMRVRRDGGSKDLRVVVGEAPEYYARRRDVAVPAGTPGAAGDATRAPEPRPMSEPSRIIVQPAPPGFSGFRYWVDYEGLAGASVETVTEGLAKALNVENGVLVVRVRPGTPAYRAGLRDGDVVVRAAGNQIRTVGNLRNVLAEGDGAEGVKLVVVRERKERDLTLRWER